MKKDTHQNILKAGEKEFLQKGFSDASLRSIAKKANVTTGAIYGYYPDKESLFEALVEPYATQLIEMFYKVQNDFSLLSEQEQIKASKQSFGSRALKDMLGFIYCHFTAFRLLIGSSTGTKYETYLQPMVEVESMATKNFIETEKKLGYHPEDVNEILVDILSHFYFSSIFEVVARNMKKEEAERYVDHITSFFIAGWSKLLGIPIDYEA